MKRIISKKDKNKENRRNQVIVGGVLILVMLFGTIGYAFTGGGSF